VRFRRSALASTGEPASAYDYPEAESGHVKIHVLPGTAAPRVAERSRSASSSTGYNAQTGEYGDMVAMGVLDPTKVTRYALQNAASVAALILTTDAMVAELPKDEKAGGGMPPGGMGGMGDMDM